MRFGPLPPEQLPVQNSSKVLRLAERWQRAAWAHEKWATPAKEAVDFFEGRQWTDEQKAILKDQKRPDLYWNIIDPIVRLVLGYHGNNKTDITFSAGQSDHASQAVADALTAIEKVTARSSKLAHVENDVFRDGLVCGRGYFKTELDFEDNDLGEVRTSAVDPFAVYIDPDCDTYDINESASYVVESKYVSIDEIESGLGKKIAQLVRPYMLGQTPIAPIASVVVNDEVTPVRYFGNASDGVSSYYDNFYSMMGDFVDTHRKTIRVIESQYKVRRPANVIIDVETGDKKVLPDFWGRNEIEKLLLFAETTGNPCVVQQRLVERLQWTTMVGDIIIYDAPSLYEKFTLTGYFPNFRRGVTRGMVLDLISPQKEKNKRKIAEIEMVSKNANGGWLAHADSLDPVQKANFKKFGSRPGFLGEWKGSGSPPVQIQPSAPPMAHERLETKSDEDIRRISGVNESALGEIDIGQSGRAIEARQRQAVIAIQIYMDNLRRSKELLGEFKLSLYQGYYTEPRIYRMTGDDGAENQVAINQEIADPASGGKRVLNDVTVGKYVVAIDEAPLSATFAAGQFEEMMSLLDKIGAAAGGALMPFFDLILGNTSLPQKDKWIERWQQVMGAQQQQAQQQQAQEQAQAQGEAATQQQGPQPQQPQQVEGPPLVPPQGPQQ